jgi:hypothetical protein
MNIDNAEVITIKTISPSATPTILRRIDRLKTENEFTTPRMDCGDPGEADRICFNSKTHTYTMPFDWVLPRKAGEKLA